MKTTTTAQLFDQLYNKSQKYVKHYREDFDIDKKSIHRNNGTKFIHMSRECGTAIFFFHKSDVYPKKEEIVKSGFNYVDRKKLLNDSCEMAFYYIENDPKIIHYFDGNKLVKITPLKAEDLVKTYKRIILSNFEE